MAFFTWKPSYSVQIKEIDDQHKRLIDILNAFYETLAKGDGAGEGVLAELLQSLTEYAGYHFATEERYMQRFDYPDISAHRSEHALFNAKVQEVKRKLDAGQLVLSIEITTFLRDWIAEHVQGSDQLYIGCFHENGLR